MMKKVDGIIVYYPETPEKQALFDKRVAKYHAEYVFDHISKLMCSTEQKLKLIDAIAESILANCDDETDKKHSTSSDSLQNSIEAESVL